MKRMLADEAATDALGRALQEALGPSGAVIFLDGPLGAGKTSLARAILRAMGEEGPVRSPTYTLMEPYEVNGRQVYHMDLYRLGDPEELAYLGVRDLDEPGLLLLVEWPERGAGMLPAADLCIRLAHAGSGREATLEGLSERGRAMLARLVA
jgi:tRNA threonylcarbamoyladenosine biosynthesis protein TsaE